MKAIKLSIAIALLTTLVLSSCSSDDGDNFTSSASNIITTIDENPVNGTTIGTVTTNLTGTLDYSISSQSTTGAFTIDNTTGVVTVSNELSFDFETNPMLTAVITVTNSAETATSIVEVTLNDVDDIASFLTTSRSAYETANDGDWILITEVEYNYLGNKLNQISRVGTTDAELVSETNVSVGVSDFTVGNDNGLTIPAGGYLIAFKYESHGDGASDSKVKISSPDVTGTYTNLGNSLPLHTSGWQHFVLKGNQDALADVGHMAFYEATGIGFSFTTDSSYFADTGDQDTIASVLTGIMIFYQGLASTQKQWD